MIRLMVGIGLVAMQVGTCSAQDRSKSDAVPGCFILEDVSGSSFGCPDVTKAIPPSYALSLDTALTPITTLSFSDGSSVVLIIDLAHHKVIIPPGVRWDAAANLFWKDLEAVVPAYGGPDDRYDGSAFRLERRRP